MSRALCEKHDSTALVEPHFAKGSSGSLVTKVVARPTGEVQPPCATRRGHRTGHRTHHFFFTINILLTTEAEPIAQLLFGPNVRNYVRKELLRKIIGP